MKRIIFTAPLALAIAVAAGQQKQGKVTYERVARLEFHFAGGNDQMEQAIPRTRTDQFELNFANNQATWQQLVTERPDEGSVWNSGGGEGGGMQIRMIAPGSNDFYYFNLDKGISIAQRELGTKNYIVEDSIRKLTWKLSADTKTILGHLCRKAVSERITTRVNVNMDNGKMTREEVPDTATVVAWITTDIPVAAGPEFSGQLPGLILELNLNDGRTVYTATSINDDTDIAKIKAPTKGKKLTGEEFAKERQKLFDEMSRNAPGGGRREIRIQN